MFPSTNPTQTNLIRPVDKPYVALLLILSDTETIAVVDYCSHSNGKIRKTSNADSAETSNTNGEKTASKITTIIDTENNDNNYYTSYAIIDIIISGTCPFVIVIIFVIIKRRRIQDLDCTQFRTLRDKLDFHEQRHRSRRRVVDASR